MGYIDAISEMIDFRLHGASETVFQKFSATELYLKRARKTVAKMMRFKWTKDLDIETLKVRGHWATMEELLSSSEPLRPDICHEICNHVSVH